MTSPTQILEKYSVDGLKDALGKLEGSRAFTISTFREHRCLDCGAKLSKIRFKRCRKCNMRLIGKRRGALK
jgi:DNA-directed RNA polymerase subunit RPC12/RpoP